MKDLKQDVNDCRRSKQSVSVWNASKNFPPILTCPEVTAGRELNSLFCAADDDGLSDLTEIAADPLELDGRQLDDAAVVCLLQCNMESTLYRIPWVNPLTMSYTGTQYVICPKKGGGSSRSEVHNLLRPRTAVYYF